MNSRPSPWQGDALPLSYSRFLRKPQFSKWWNGMYPFFYPFVQRPYFLQTSCFHQGRLPLKHADASRCGMPFSQSHGTARRYRNPAVSKDDLGPRPSHYRFDSQLSPFIATKTDGARLGRPFACGIALRWLGWYTRRSSLTRASIPDESPTRVVALSSDDLF